MHISHLITCWTRSRIISLGISKMDSDEVVKVNFYLSELRSLGAMHSTTQKVDMLDKTINTMKKAVDTLIRSKIKHSGELLDSDKLRQECDQWEQLVCRMMSLVEEAHTKIATLADAVTKLVERNVAGQNSAIDANAKNEAKGKIQNEKSTDQMDTENDEEIPIYRCHECPRAFTKMALLYRHEVKIHGQHSVAEKQKKSKKAKAKVAAKTMKKKHMIDAIKIIKLINDHGNVSNEKFKNQ